MQRTGAERLKMGCYMHSTAQALAKAYIAGQHPDAHLGELKQRLFLHFYGADFAPQERTRILLALSVRRPHFGAPAPVRPTTGKPLEGADLATGKLPSQPPCGKAATRMATSGGTGLNIAAHDRSKNTARTCKRSREV
jgi:hypothetical protein